MKALLLAVLSGVLYALAYPGLEWWPLVWIAFVPLLWALDGAVRGLGHALGTGLLCGAVAHLSACYWLLPTLVDFAQLSWPLAFAVWLAMCAYQGAAFALFAALSWAVKRRGYELAWVAPCALGVVEAIYPALFPSYVGAVLRPLSLLQVADLGGPVLVSMLAMSLNAAVFAATRALVRGLPERARRRAVLRPLIGAAALLAAVQGYAVVRRAEIQRRIAGAPSLRVGIVQANAPPHLNLEDRKETRRRYADQSKRFAQPVELLIWPETTLHYALHPDIKSVRQLLGPLATPIVFGGLAQGPGSTLYNRAYLADASGKVLGRTDKQRLIPFAEYVPFREVFPALERALPHSGQFVPGPERGSLQLRSHRIAITLCYEDLLPDFVRSQVSRSDPHLLVNLSNDVWFGRSPATHVHQVLAQLRAIEQRRFMVRANNSGVSSVIDPTGVVVTRSTPFAPQNVVAQVALLGGETWFTRSGNLSAWIAAAALLLALAWKRVGGASRGREQQQLLD